MKPMMNMRMAVFTALLSMSYTVAQASEANFPTTPPAPGPAPTLTIPTPSMQVLDNGLQVISIRRAQLPLVTAQLVVRSGGEMDPPELAGLVDLTATLLGKGAGGRSAPEIAAAAEALGGSLSAQADWDESAVGITVTTPKLPQALALLGDVVRRPSFRADELKRAQTQAIDDLRLSLSQPTALASLVAGRAVYGDGAYGHSGSGTPASLARISRDDVQRVHATLYRPDNAMLVLAGDITPEQAKVLANAAFGDWQAPSTALPARPLGSGQRALPSTLLIDQSGAGQAGVVVAHPAPARGDADYYVGTLANAVLGGSYSARLNQEIRIKRGLSYGANSRLEQLADAGMWRAASQTKNPSAPEVVELMLGEFSRLGDTPVGAAELAARKATLTGSYGRSLETTAGLASEVTGLALYGQDLAAIGQYIERVQAVTPDQIQDYAARHLGADRGTVVVVGDAGQFAPALRKRYPKATLLDAKLLDLDSPSLTSGNLE